MKRFVVLLLIVSIILAPNSIVFATDTINLFFKSFNGTPIYVRNESKEAENRKEFDSKFLNYTISVDYEVDKIRISELVFKGKDTYNNHKDYELNVGVNVLKYQPTGMDKIYTFTVTRDAKPEDKNDVTLIEILNYYNKDIIKHIEVGDKAKEILKYYTNTIKYIKLDENANTYSADVSSDINRVIISAKTNSLVPLSLPEDYSNGVEIHPGENKIEIPVKSKSGLTKTFTLFINRDKSSVTSFDFFEVSKYDSKGKEIAYEDINYNPNSSNYNMDVSYDVSSIAVLFPASDKVYSDILCNDGHDSKFKLKVGKNKIKLTIVAENGNKKDYMLTVNRLKASTKLDWVNVNEYTCGLDSDSYTLEVGYDTTKAKINAVPEDKSAKVTGNGTYNLKVGANKFNIIVTAADKTQKKYTLIVNRSKKKSVKVIYYWVVVK